MKANGVGRRHPSGFPQHVRAGERGVSAQIDFDGWRKPAQVESVRARHEKRGFGQIHFARDVLYPLRVARLWKDAHGGGIAAEGLGMKASTWTIGSVMPSTIHSELSICNRLICLYAVDE